MPLIPKHQRTPKNCQPGCGQPKLPSLGRRAVNFSKAATKHIVAGRPKRSAQGKALVLATCALNTCGMYIAPSKPGGSAKCAHRDCGCSLERKAGWADTECPLPGEQKLWTIELPKQRS